MAQKINQTGTILADLSKALAPKSAMQPNAAEASSVKVRKQSQQRADKLEKDEVVVSDQVEGVQAEASSDVIVLAQASVPAAPSAAAAPIAAAADTAAAPAAATSAINPLWIAAGVGGLALAGSGGGSSSTPAAVPPPAPPVTTVQSFTLTDRAVTYKLVTDIDTSGLTSVVGAGFNGRIDPSWFVREGEDNTLTTQTKSAGVLSSAVAAHAGTDKIYADAFTLHGAYIDAGAGKDYLFIDMKGPFSQPAMVAGVEVVTVTNLANIYDENVKYFTGGVTNNTGLNLDGVASHVLDLSRAIDLETLIVREGGNAGGANGSLDIWNVRSDTNIVLSGYFEQDTRIDFDNGQDALNLTLSNFKQANTSDLLISHDASVVNLKSLGQVNEDGSAKTGSVGSGNFIDGTVFGPMLTTLNISGGNFLQITNNAVNFREDVTATINASASTGGVEIVMAPHNDVRFTGGSVKDTLLVQGALAPIGGDNVIKLVANMGEGSENIVNFNAGAAARVTRVLSGSSITDTGAGTTTVVVTGGVARATSVIDLTAVDVSDVDSFKFDNANASIQLRAAQTSADVLAKFEPTNALNSNGGLIVSALDAAAINLTGLKTGVAVSLMAKGAVTINAASVLGNDTQGAAEVVIDARGGDASVTMTAAQFAQLQGNGNVEVLTNNNPLTNANYKAGLKLTGIAAGQEINFNDVNNNGGLSEITLVIDGTTTRFAPTAQFAVTDAVNSNVILEISGDADLTNANLANVDGIRLVNGAKVTLTEAQMEGFSRVTGAGDLTIELANGANIITMPTSTGGNVDYTGINLVLKNEAGLAATATVEFAGNRDIKLKGIDTLAGVTALTVQNNMGAGTTLDITGGTPALDLNVATTALTINGGANSTVIGSSPSFNDISGSGLTAVTLNAGAGGSINGGTLHSASSNLVVSGTAGGGTETIGLPSAVPANADWTFNNVQVSAVIGTAFATGASLTTAGTTSFTGGIAVQSVPLTQNSVLSVTNANSVAEINTLLGKLSGATAFADVSGMSVIQLQAVAANVAKISAPAANTVTGLVGNLSVTKDLSNTEITQLLGRFNMDVANTGSSVVDASSMTAAQLAAVAGQVANVDRINSLSLTNAQTAPQLTSLIGVAQGATVNATTMTTAQVSAVAVAIGNAAGASNVSSVTGLTLRVGQSDAEMANLFSKVAAAASVAVDARTFSSAQMTAVVANIAKVSAVNNLTVTFAARPTEATDANPVNLVALLGKSVTARVDAADMTTALLKAIAANGTNVAAITNLTVNSTLEAAEITALAGKAAAYTASLTDLTDAQFAAVQALPAGVSVTGVTTTARLTAMDTAKTTTLNATGVTQITGSLADLQTVMDADEGVVSMNFTTVDDPLPAGKKAVSLMVNDAASATLTAAGLNTLDEETAGTITVSNAVTITGSLSNLTTAVVETTGTNAFAHEAGDDGIIAATANLSITDVAGTLMTAVGLSDLGGTTSGTVTVQNAASISGTALALTAALVTATTKVVAASSNVLVTAVASVTTQSDQQVIADIDATTTGTLTVQGTSGADTLTFTGYSAGVLTIEGGFGNDTITGTSGADVIKGDAGNDTLQFATAAAADAATIDGGADADIIRIAAQVTSVLDLNTTAESVQNVESLVLALGSTAAVSLDAGMTSASITSGAGNITLTTVGQDVTGANNGALTVRAANALLSPTTTVITGGTGTGDNIIITDLVASSLGLNSTAAMIVGVESLTLALGSTATVSLDADMTDATVASGAGDVTLSAVGQDVDGAANGALTVRSSLANIAGSIIKGDNASGDTLVISDAITEVTDFNTYADLQGVEVLNLALGSSAKVTMDAAMTSVVIAAGASTIETNAAGQTVNANALVDAQVLTLTDTATTTATVTLVGGDLTASDYDGALMVTATTGSNIITTGAGNDTLNGGAGNDIVTGGAGADNLTGGLGSDAFVFNPVATNGIDTITDFAAGLLASGGDVLNFAAITGLGGTANTIAAQAIATAVGTARVAVLTDDNAGNAAALKTALDGNANWDEANIGDRIVVWEISSTSVGVALVNNSDAANDNDVTVNQLATLTGFADQTAVSAFTAGLIASNFIA
jgi:hypothetical protein